MIHTNDDFEYQNHSIIYKNVEASKIEKVPRGIQGENSRNDTVSSIQLDIPDFKNTTQIDDCNNV